MDNGARTQVYRKLITLPVALLIATCAHAEERWFGPDLVASGSVLFQQHCAVCHGANAEGTADWKKTDADGNYPPPPLDGSAHAWHHSIPQLARSIKQGGKPYGGTMPGFGDQFEDRQLLALIAYFQSKWPDEIYRRWHQQYMQ